MVLAALQILVFFMGLFSIASAIKNAMFFIKAEQRVAGSMVRMLLEQCISSMGTLLFSLNSLVLMLSGESSALWNSVNPYVANAIRITMFGAMIHSTTHLSESIKKIIASNTSENEQK